MTDSEHVMLSGDGASLFAKEQGLEIVAASYFYTEQRFKALQKVKNSQKIKSKVLINKLLFTMRQSRILNLERWAV